jgi:hypothetical protein
MTGLPVDLADHTLLEVAGCPGLDFATVPASNPKGVLHTVEGTNPEAAFTTYRARRCPPHVTWDPVADRAWLHVRPGRGAYALANLAGGVETNRANVRCQVEILGFAADAPGRQPWWYAKLAARIVQWSTAFGVPARVPCEFAGNAAYGLRGVVRLTGSQFLGVSGWIGHQHVPENDHWDPGHLDRARLAAAIAAQETDMPQAADILAKLDELRASLADWHHDTRSLTPPRAVKIAGDPAQWIIQAGPDGRPVRWHIPDLDTRALLIAARALSPLDPVELTGDLADALTRIPAA